MKKILFLFAILLFQSQGFAQLSAGDIAFVQYNADATDNFAFVCLVDIPAGEVIKFTDNEENSLSGGEGTITWTAPAAGVTCGTVVTINVSPSASIGSVTETNSLNFGSSGDAILAYQGTTSSPTFIAALSNDGGSWGGSKDGNLPSGLTNGTTAVAVSEVDNCAYSGATSGDRSTLLSALNNPSNWTTNTSNTSQQTFSGTFTVTGCGTPATPHTVIFNSNGGTGTMANQTASSSTALTTNAFTRSGFTFSGWNTAANGSGTAYADGASYSFSADVTLYAQWTASGGGSSVCLSENFDGSTSNYTRVGTYIGSSSSNARSGNKFIGFNTAGSNPDKLEFTAVDNPNSIKFYARLSSGSGSRIKIQYKNGATWTDIGSDQTVTGTSYSLYTFDVSSLSSSTNVLLRIVMVTKNNSIYLDDLEVLCGSSSPTCTHTITSFVPTSGPVGTEITITGTGFTGSSTVEINGNSATVVSQTVTELVVEVPSGATTGAIKVTENSCDATSTDFTVLDESGSCNSGGDYTITLWHNGIETTSDANYNVDLTGTIPNNTAWRIGCGSGSASGTNNPSSNTIPFGFNSNERIVLYKDGVAIDRFGTAGTSNWMTTGRNYRRSATITGPTATYNASEWTTASYTTSSLGSHTFDNTLSDLVISETADPTSGNSHYIEIYNNTGSAIDLNAATSSPPSVSAQPADVSACSADFSVTATAGNGGALTYQWYFNNRTSATWQNVSVANLPGNLTVSGANTNSLSISSNTVSNTSLIDHYQFYCDVTEAGTCHKVSVVAEFIHAPDRYFRSKGTGNWNDVSSWEMATSSAGPWSDACIVPDASNSDYIYVKSGDTVTIIDNTGTTPDVEADQIQISGILIVEPSAELNLNNGTGVELLIKDGGTFIDRSNSGSGNGPEFATNATWQIEAGGTLVKTNTGSATVYRNNYETGIANIPVGAKWIYRYNGDGNVVIANSASGNPMYYPELVFESTSGNHDFDALSEVFKGRHERVTIKGDLSIGISGGAVKVFNNNFNTNPSILLQGDFYLGAGSEFTNEAYTTGGGYGTSHREGSGVEFKGDLLVEGTLDFNHSASSGVNGVTPGEEGLVFSGSSSQDIVGGTAESFVIKNFTINNANNVELTDINLEIIQKLKFITGKIITDVTNSDMVWVKNSAANAISGGNSSGTSNYVEGKLQWTLAQGNTYTFPIGHSAQNAQGFEFTPNAGSGNILGYLETNSTAPTQSYAYCDLETATATNQHVGEGSSGTDGILDQVEFNLQSPLQWDVTNPAGGITDYNITVLANGSQDISPVSSANSVAVRYLLKNGQAYDGATAATVSVAPDFSATGFEACPNQYTLTGMTSFSDFTINGANQANTQLPAELVAFDAKRSNQQVNLIWETASERNVSHFIVEKSKDLNNFQDVLTENAAGNSTSTINYSGVDDNPLNGVSYYRLKIIDFDGQYEYSPIRKVQFEKGNVSVVYSENNWDISYKTDSKFYTVHLYNSLGQEIARSKMENNSGNGSVAHSDLSPGMYIIVIEDNNVKESIKVIK